MQLPTKHLLPRADRECRAGRGATVEILSRIKENTKEQLQTNSGVGGEFWLCVLKSI